MGGCHAINRQGGDRAEVTSTRLVAPRTPDHAWGVNGRLRRRCFGISVACAQEVVCSPWGA